MTDLNVVSVTFSYGNKSEKALHNFSLSVDEGKIHALLGPNGAGKTTLMRIITGQLRGYAGEVFISRSKMPDRKALLSVGYAPQPISLYAELTAYENLRFFGSLAGLSPKLLAERSEAVLEETMLTPFSSKRVGAYSGGMLRRLNLAVALLHSPELLLLDEPTSGVDPQSRLHIYETIARLNAKGTTVLLCTHIMEEAQRLCSKLTLVDKGGVIFDGAMDKIDRLEKFFLEKTGRGLRDE